jgi:hypothetical protein
MVGVIRMTVMKWVRLGVLSLSAVAAVSGTTQAQDIDPVLDLTIANVTVTPVDESEVITRKSLNAPRVSSGLEDLNEVGATLDAFEVVFDKVVNLGQKIWKLAEEGRPVVSTKWTTANALPGGVESWRQMSGWQNPRSQLFRVTYENVYGVTVIDFTFRVSYTAGGNVGGRGQYLSRVSLQPANLLVRWGFNFDAVAEVADVVNVGTLADPVAGMELLLSWKTSTVMNTIESTASYFVRGDGQLLDLTAGRN